MYALTDFNETYTNFKQASLEEEVFCFWNDFDCLFLWTFASGALHDKVFFLSS